VRKYGECTVPEVFLLRFGQNVIFL
jgi:hypothetical protein